MDDDLSVSRQTLAYATHNAEHASLDARQRLAVQHLRECLERLLRNRERYYSLNDSLPISPLGLAKTVTGDMQHEVFDLVEAFHDQAYKTLSALAAVHSRIAVYPDMPRKAIGSNERFLAWWEEGVMKSAHARRRMRVLQESRDFRTLVNHPAANAIFEWGTIATKLQVEVVLHGYQSSSGKIPSGASRDPNGGGGWLLVPPPMDAVLDAFEQLALATFGPLPDLYPLGMEAEFCSWEADGFGSTLGIEAAAKLRPEVANLIATQSTRLAPDALHELDGYIDAMRRGQAIPRPVSSAYPSPLS